MQTCGFMMSRVSLPIKWITGQKWNWWYRSFIPKIFVVATWSSLNKKGNSELMHALELLTTKLECLFFKVVVSATLIL
jgi:hypothetical protein